ncbi:Hypothetical predicted protein [Octopus vulgaris]|uniref:Uncharacterized protein n=1 Tax=Octopus vulgaris TaxID=6645 RepID=A0AA36BQ79_OCTVU|nr:Hypothetical predicted protein [Octopus vulgaris]
MELVIVVVVVVVESKPLFSFLVVVIKGQISTPQRVVTEDTEVKDSVTVPTQTLTESQTGGRILDVPTGVTISDIDSSTTETVESDSVTGTEQNLPKASFTNTKVVEYTAPTTSTSNTNSSMDTSTDTNNNNKSNSNATSNIRVNSLALSSVSSATILDINDSTKESVFTAIDVDVTTTTTTASTTTTTTTATTAAVTTTIASKDEIVVSTRLPNSELVQRPTDFSVTRIQTALPTPPIGVEPNKDQLPHKNIYPPYSSATTATTEYCVFELIGAKKNGNSSACLCTVENMAPFKV